MNTLFTLSQPYASGTSAVFVNGQLRNRVLDDGWVESSPGSGQINLKEAPTTGDVVQVFYQDSSPPLPETIVSDIRGTMLDTTDELSGALDPTEEISGVLVMEVPIFGTVRVRKSGSP